MVFLDVVVVAFALGLLLGGDPARLGRLRIQRIWLFFVALGIQLVAFPTAHLPWSTPDGVARGLWLASYAVLIAAALSNRGIAGVPIMAAGLLLNLTAILANRGHMPVLPSALAAEGRSYKVHDNSIQLVHPHLAWLVDRWAVPGWIPFGNVFSVGDVLIAAGAAVLIVCALQPRALDRLRRRPRAQSEACPTTTSA
jgi:hypothetical protein